MAERTGTVLSFNQTNRQGQIRPDDGTAPALFYLPAVTNAEPLPKRNDKVTFDAPEPRKNKKGKLVQGNATSVTITERAPEPPPEQKRAAPAERRGRAGGRGGDRRRGRDGGRGRPGKGAPGERRVYSASGSKEGGTGEGRRERRPRRPRPERSEQRSEQRREARRERKPRERRNTEPRNKSQKGTFSFPLSADFSGALSGKRGAHAGLVAEKLIAWPSPKKGEQQESWDLQQRHRSYFLERIVEPSFRNYQMHSLPWKFIRARWAAIMESYRARGFSVQSVKLKTESRLAAGFSSPSLFDGVGITLERTWGYPFIAGATLKGALRRHLDRTAADREAEVRKIRELLGDEQKNGSIIFFDAIPENRVTRLDLDPIVNITPDYYGGDAPPADNQDPEFITTAALPAGVEFRFSVAVSPGGEEQIARVILELLTDALSSMGIGGRKGVGYGRFGVSSAGRTEAGMPPPQDPAPDA